MVSTDRLSTQCQAQITGCLTEGNNIRPLSAWEVGMNTTPGCCSASASVLSYLGGMS